MAFRSWKKVLGGTLLSTTTKGLFQFRPASRLRKIVGSGLRVSTKEQGRSGLGLAAQRHEIEAFALREGFAVKPWHQDIQTGAGADALLFRPGLATALKGAKSAARAVGLRTRSLLTSVHSATTDIRGE